MAHLNPGPLYVALPSHSLLPPAHVVSMVGVQGDVGCRVRHPTENLSPRPVQLQKGRGGSGDAEACRATLRQAYILPINQDSSWNRGYVRGRPTGQGWADESEGEHMTVKKGRTSDGRRESLCHSRLTTLNEGNQTDPLKVTSSS